MYSKPYKYLINIFVTIIIMAALYVAIFRASMDTPVKAAWWVKDVADYKIERIKDLGSPRLIVAGGSSALFGFDSNALSGLTGYNVVTLGLHVSLDLRFYLELLRPHIRQNDIVLLSLEYSYYFRDSRYNDWYVNNVMAWGKDQYLDKLSLLEQAEFLVHVPPRRILSGLLSRSSSETKTLGVEQVSEIVRDAAKRRPDKQVFKGYGPKSFNGSGDINVYRNVSKKLLDVAAGRGYIYLREGKALKKSFKRDFKELAELIESRSAKLLVTWPPMIRSQLLDVSQDSGSKQVISFLDAVSEAGLEFICNPADSTFAPYFFYDSNYHLNAEGVALRMRRLAACLSEQPSPLAAKPIAASGMTNYPQVLEELKAQANSSYLTKSPRAAAIIKNLINLEDMILLHRQSGGDIHSAQQWQPVRNAADILLSLSKQDSYKARALRLPPSAMYRGSTTGWEIKISGKRECLFITTMVPHWKYQNEKPCTYGIRSGLLGG